MKKIILFLLVIFLVGCSQNTCVDADNNGICDDREQAIKTPVEIPDVQEEVIAVEEQEDVVSPVTTPKETSDQKYKTIQDILDYQYNKIKSYKYRYDLGDDTDVIVYHKKGLTILDYGSGIKKIGDEYVTEVWIDHEKGTYYSKHYDKEYPLEKNEAIANFVLVNDLVASYSSRDIIEITSRGMIDDMRTFTATLNGGVEITFEEFSHFPMEMTEGQNIVFRLSSVAFNIPERNFVRR